MTSLDDGTTHSGFASGTGTLGTSFTAKIDNGSSSAGNTLTVTLPTGAVPSNAYIGIGTQVCPAVQAPSAFTCANVTALGTGVGYNGTYTIDGSAQLVTSQVMFGSGALPGPATTLQWTASAGTPVIGMAVNDGGASLTASPLLVTAVSGTTPNYVLTVAGNYYPSISADATMQASLTTLVPGEYIQNSAITNPVKIIGYGSGAIGLLGNYTLSASPNAAGAVGSSGSPVVFTGTTITDGGAIAPGSALTIRDQGPFITFPLTNIGAKTGTIALSGDYDTGTLGGTPSGHSGACLEQRQWTAARWLHALQLGCADRNNFGRQVVGNARRHSWRWPVLRLRPRHERNRLCDAAELGQGRMGFRSVGSGAGRFDPGPAKRNLYLLVLRSLGLRRMGRGLWRQ